MIGWVGLALIARALAVPGGDAHVYGSIGEDTPGFGAGLGMSFRAGPVRLEPGAEIGLVGLLEEVHGRFMVRYPFVDSERRFVPSARLGPGFRWTPEEVSPSVMGGLGLDFPAFWGLRPRLGVDAMLRWKGPVSGRATLSLIIPPARRTPALPAVDPVADAVVWVPHPICQWVPADQLEAWLPVLPPEEPLRVRAPGYLSAEAPAAGVGEVVLQPAPVHGSVVVLAAPGDVVRVGDLERVATADGVVVLGLPVGLTSIEVSGQGRVERLDAAVADGFAVWMRVPAAGPQTIRFAAGSADLDDSERARLANLAENAGGARFRVVGSHSPEGDPAGNEMLAQDRAAAVVEALVEAGLTADRVEAGAPVEPEEGLSPEEQRVVVVTPLAGGGG